MEKLQKHGKVHPAWKEFLKCAAFAYAKYKTQKTKSLTDF